MTYWQAILQEMNELIASPSEENIVILKGYLVEKDAGTNEKHVFPYYAARMFLFLGTRGVQILGETINQAPGRILPTAILETLYFASQKKLKEIPLVNNDLPLLLIPVIDDEVAKLATEKLHELVSESLTNRRLFGIIINFIFQQEFTSYEVNDHSLVAFIFQAFRENSIKINKKVIENYQKIIQNPTSSEEDCQKYLFEHPVLIDPLAKEIIPKQRLGSDYITDFVIKKYNDEYVLVEIEKPSTPIFTKSNDFTSKFSHALGQVIDFQEWVETNISYANTQMPSISSPSGILILGMMSTLTELQKKKLRRFNINNQGKVRVMTFDEVLQNSMRLYNNIIN